MLKEVSNEEDRSLKLKTFESEIFKLWNSGIWRVKFVCEGTTGHGSLLHENTAGEKLRRILG